MSNVNICRALSKFGDLGIPVSFFVKIYGVRKFLSDFSSRKFSECLFDATSFTQLNASNPFGIRIFSGVILCKNSWFCKNSCLVLNVEGKIFLAQRFLSNVNAPSNFFEPQGFGNSQLFFVEISDLQKCLSDFNLWKFWRRSFVAMSFIKCKCCVGFFRSLGIQEWRGVNLRLAGIFSRA